MEQQAANLPEAGVASAPPSAQEQEDLRRSLSQKAPDDDRHCRGDRSGLFLGSGLTIQLAGPGVIISYLIGAAIAAVIAYCLAEMAVVHPFSGSFGIYAESYLSRWAMLQGVGPPTRMSTSPTSDPNRFEMGVCTKVCPPSSERATCVPLACQGDPLGAIGSIHRNGRLGGVGFGAR